MTRSTLARIVALMVARGSLHPDDLRRPVLVAASVRGFVRGLRARRYYRNIERAR